MLYFDGVEPTPTSGLYDILAHARALYGAGMGLTSFGVFATIIRTSLGLRWTPFGPAADAFAVIDGDICQAIQSSKEEIDSGRGGDLEIARAKVADLRAALKESSDVVSRWGGDFPFDRRRLEILTPLFTSRARSDDYVCITRRCHLLFPFSPSYE